MFNDKDNKFMSSLDFIFLVAVAVSAIYGYYKGFVSQIGSLVGVMVGMILCRVFAEDLAQFMNVIFLDSTTSKDSSRFLNSVIAQIVIFMIGYFGVRILAKVMSITLNTVKLGKVNSIFGAIFGLVQGLMLLSLSLNLWIAIFPESEIATDSNSFFDEAVIDLAPNVLGSDTAQEFYNKAQEIGK